MTREEQIRRMERAAREAEAVGDHAKADALRYAIAKLVHGALATSRPAAA